MRQDNIFYNMTDKDLEIARLREALQQSKKEVKSLKGKLSTAKAKAEKAREEVKSLKKNARPLPSRRRCSRGF